MAKRSFDLAVAALGLTATAPILAFASMAIWLSRNGPVLFRADRVGKNGSVFCLYKLRTMVPESGAIAPVVTTINDQRVFPVGGLLRITKIDELPQLLNVLRGDMSIIGPRPEDPRIVDRYYAEGQRETLAVLPGLLGPGSIFYYTHGHCYLAEQGIEHDYANKLLPIKLALDAVYIRHATLRYDIRLILRALGAIVGKLLGFSNFGEPPEMEEARRISNEWEVRWPRRSHDDGDERSEN